MNELTTAELLKEIGRRLRRERMNQRLTQDMLAERAGLRQATISRVEAGNDFTFETLIEMLRALDRLEALDALLPEPQVSPIELVERQGQQAQRVRPRRAEPAAPWHWRDESELQAE